MDPILATTDLSPRGEIAIDRAASLARTHGAPLFLLHVVEDDRPGDAVLGDAADAQAELDTKAAALGLPDVRVMVETGHPAILIPRIARQTDAALVVFGAHRNRGLSDWVGRPNLVRLLGGLETAALVAHLPPERAYEDVLVGWDFSEAARAAAHLADGFCPQARLALGHAIAPMPLTGISPSTTIADLTAADLSGELDALRIAADRRGAAALWHHGAPASALRVMGRDNGADLIAVGRHRRTPIGRLMLGETSMALATDAPCDLLIAPPA